MLYIPRVEGLPKIIPHYVPKSFSALRDEQIFPSAIQGLKGLPKIIGHNVPKKVGIQSSLRDEQTFPSAMQALKGLPKFTGRYATKTTANDISSKSRRPRQQLP
jgi:hypothetical protein